MEYYDNLIQQELFNEIKNQKVKVENNYDIYYQTLKNKYPIRGSHIEWDKIKLQYKILSKDLEDNKIDTIKDFLKKIMTKHHIKENQEVTFIGDVLDIALHMNLSIFLKNLDVLLSYPQDLYLVPPQFDWCLNFLFEEDLYFGFA